jgi:hypothetical protein
MKTLCTWKPKTGSHNWRNKKGGYAQFIAEKRASWGTSKSIQAGMRKCVVLIAM